MGRFNLPQKSARSEANGLSNLSRFLLTCDAAQDRIPTAQFGLPPYLVVPFVPLVTEHLMLETDFVNEAEEFRDDAQACRLDPSLRRVYVSPRRTPSTRPLPSPCLRLPTAYPELSSTRVLAEWIEGVRLWDPVGS